MEPVLEGVETGEEKSKVVNKLQVDGGMKKEDGRGKKEGSVKEGPALPLCAPYWRKEKGE